MEVYHVYILKSDKTGRYYTGVSAKPDSRLYFHNKGLNRSTRTGVPWIRLWLSNPMTQAEALVLERRIKKRGAGRYLREL